MTAAAKDNCLDISDSGFFVLRTPLLPFDEFLKWGDGVLTRRAWEQGSDDGEVRALVAYLKQLSGLPGAEREQATVKESPIRVGE